MLGILVLSTCWFFIISYNFVLSFININCFCIPGIGLGMEDREMDIREFPGGSVIRTQRFHRGPVSRMVQKKKREREMDIILSS